MTCPPDLLGALDEEPIVGRLAAAVERALQQPGQIERTARAIVESHFPVTIAPDVLVAVGLDPDVVLSSGGEAPVTKPERRRSSAWPAAILAAWDQQCAFCGYDGRLGSGTVGIEAAHVRWFNFDGPDDLDNGLALCSLHHKLFDRGALGLSAQYRGIVSSAYSAATEAGKQVYRLHENILEPRPGTPVPNAEHVDWHTRQVFKGVKLAA